MGSRSVGWLMSTCPGFGVHCSAVVLYGPAGWVSEWPCDTFNERSPELHRGLATRSRVHTRAHLYIHTCACGAHRNWDIGKRKEYPVTTLYSLRVRQYHTHTHIHTTPLAFSLSLCLSYTTMKIYSSSYPDPVFYASLRRQRAIILCLINNCLALWVCRNACVCVCVCMHLFQMNTWPKDAPRLAASLWSPFAPPLRSNFVLAERIDCL